MRKSRIILSFLMVACFAKTVFPDSLFSDLSRYLQVESNLKPSAPRMGVIAFDRLTFDASVTAIGGSNRRESAKFQEYRDIPNGALTSFVADYWGENYRFFGSLKNAGLDDQFFQFRAESFGKYRVNFTYNQIPHRFAFDARSLFSGVGTGLLQVPDAFQTANQNSTSEVDLANKLQAEFQSAKLFDSENLRKQADVSMDMFNFQPWRLKAELKYETRSGVRPFSGSFGFGNYVELPMPTDYDTTDVKVGSEYTNKKMYVSASYSASVFRNNVTALTFDNPLRITDSTLPTPFTILSSFQGGPASGRIDLFPSNNYQDISFTAAFPHLRWHSNFSAVFNWGFLRQNDPLLPFTTNTAIVPGAPNNPPFPAADLGSLPVDRVNLKMNTPNLQLSYNIRPRQKFQIKSSYRFYSLNNDAHRISFPGIVREDAEFEYPITPGATFTNLPISYDQNTFVVDAIYDVWKASQLSFGYSFDKTGRDFREVTDLHENRFRASFDTHPKTWIDFRTSYERSNRKGNGYDFSQSFTNRGEQVFDVFPFLRKFDEANRNRDDFQLQTNFYPIPAWTLTGSVIYGKDAFNDSLFGLTGDKHRIFTIETSYALTERLDANAYYSFERYESSQRARAWLPGGPGDPYTLEPTPESDSNWTDDSKDDVRSFMVGFHAVVLPPKWTVNFNVLYSKSDGLINFASPVGFLDLNPFTPATLNNIDDVTRVSVSPELSYAWRKDVSLRFGYWYEKYNIDDFNVNGFVNIPLTLDGAYNGALLMGTLPKDYSANTVYFTVQFKL